MTQTAVASATREAAVGRFMAKVYLIMAIGLAVTGAVATWVARDLENLLAVATDPWLAFGLFIIQIVLVVALVSRVGSIKAGVAFLLFIAYSALTGITLSTLVLVYADQDISSIFWATAGMFFLCSLIGLVTKRDWGGAGSVLLMLLLGWLVAYTFSFFLGGDGAVNWALTFFGIVLFAGLTAWDNNRLKALASAYGDTIPGSFAVNGALALYLDFINLFLLLLRASR